MSESLPTRVDGDGTERDRMESLQGRVHLLEGSVGLLEESVDDAPAELPLLFVVVHLQDLLERNLIYAVTEVQNARRPSITLQIAFVSPSTKVTVPDW